MTTIYKYHLSIADQQIVSLPRGAVVLSVMLQAGRLCLWAQITQDVPIEARTIFIFGTGHAIPDLALRYLASVIDGQFVWHVYEQP